MRLINFNPGPAALPLPALERARDELLDFEGSGMSILEHSHRGKEYEAVHNEAIALLTELLRIPKSHQVLFLQGGASHQFAMLPLNFLTSGKSADYVLTGIWSEKALEEAQRVGQVRVAGSTKEPDGRYVRVPKASELTWSPDAVYAHFTSNNTLYGTQWFTWPDAGAVPLVCDMSSDFLWRPFDVSPFSLLYASAQKNVGPAGVTVVVVRKDWLFKARTDIPLIFRYATHAENNSLYNTIPTFGIYLMRNVLAWTKQNGALAEMERCNRAKAGALYSVLDRFSDFYRSGVEKSSRSVMNIVFRLPTEALEDAFVKEAKQQGMVGLKGHRIVGGIRVSAYNAVSESDVQTLVAFMETFAKQKG
ncbi:MAG: 3-phosphoserine/phosphohydroxythreonine transaminase [Myxococcaceae bacterium]